MIIHERDRIDRSSLNDSAVENLSEIVILTGVASFLEVVVEWTVEERELGLDTIEVAVDCPARST